MERKRTEKVIAVVALVIAIIGLSIGFAAMSTTLQIQGTAQMNPATWEIRFENLSAPVITGDATVTTAPVLSDTTIQTFAVTLTKPGDSVTYTFDVTNAGSINALLGTFTKAANPTCTGTGAAATADAAIVCGNLIYTLTYTGGAAVGANDTLLAGQTRNMTLRIEYSATATQLPQALVNISNMGITLLYVQN